MKVLGISGSLRRDSYNTKLLRAAEELLPAIAELEIWDGLKDIPPFDEDDEPGTAVVASLRDAVANADVLLFATPEYNASVPGQLKNAVDWLSRPVATSVLRGKPVLVVGASTGAFGAVWAQAELRKVLATAGARVVEAELAVGHAAGRFDENAISPTARTVSAVLPGESAVTCGIPIDTRLGRTARPIGTCAAFHSPASPRMEIRMSIGIWYGTRSDVNALIELPRPLDWSMTVGRWPPR